MKTFIKIFNQCKEYPKPYYPYGKMDLFIDVDSRLSDYLKYTYREWNKHLNTNQ